MVETQIIQCLYPYYNWFTIIVNPYIQYDNVFITKSIKFDFQHITTLYFARNDKRNKKVLKAVSEALYRIYNQKYSRIKPAINIDEGRRRAINAVSRLNVTRDKI